MSNLEISPEGKRYGVGKGWKVFTWIFGSGIVVLFLTMPVLAAQAENSSLGLTIGAIVVFIPMAIWFIFGILEVTNTYITFYPDGIVKTNLRSKQVYKYQDLAYFSSDKNYFYLHPRDKKQKVVKFSSYTEKSYEWREILESQLGDKLASYEAFEESQILSNEEFGRDEEERAQSIMRARRISRAVNFGAWVLAAITFFDHDHPALFTALNIIYPLLAIVLMILEKGRIRILVKDQSKYPNVISALYVPSAFMMLMAVINYDYLDLTNLWTMTLIAVLPVGALLWKAMRYEAESLPRKKRVEAMFVIIFFAAIYIPSSVLMINCVYDESVPEIHQVSISNKYISKGKSTNYYIEFPSWQDSRDTLSAQVSADSYEAYQPGSQLEVYEFEGSLSIPWFLVGYPE